MIASARPYSDYKSSGSQWLGDVPAHWTVHQLRHLGRMLKGTGGTKEDDRQAGIACVRYGELYAFGGGFIRRPRRFVSPRVAAHYTPIERGDVLFAGSGEKVDEIGKSAVNLLTEPAVCGGDVIILRPTMPIVPEFLGYACDWHGAAHQKATFCRGTTIKHIYPDELRALLVALPPPDEQAAIVRYLAWATGRIDRAIRAKKKVIALLNEQKQAIIHRAVTRGLDPSVPMKASTSSWFPSIPANWSLLALRRVIFAAIDGPHFSPRYVERGVPFLSARNIRSDRWLLDDAKFISDADYATFSKRVRPELGDVLYTKGGTTGVARAVDLDFPFQVWVHIAVLKLRRDRILPSYLAYCLNSPRCYEQSQLFTRGATNQDLGLGRMKEIVMPVAPTLEEQGQIVRALDEQTHAFVSAIVQLEREIALLREYRTRLVADVVTGKLDVREAAARLPDESAPDDDASTDADADEEATEEVA